MTLDPALLEIVVCPVCRGSFSYDERAQELACQSCRRVYPVEDGIPVLLAEHARQD